MSDLISRHAAIEAVRKGCEEWRGIFQRCEENIKAIEAEPVRHGRWIRVEDPRYATDREGGLEDAGVSYHCSECGHVGWGSENYCPICGTKMDGE